MPTDNRTTNYSFKKPFAGNNLSDDVGRLVEALDSIDTQLKSTNDAVAGKQATIGYTPENAASKGVANGYASLDGSGLVPAGQLPSYVDDVLEYANFADLPGTGESGKIYVLLTPYTASGITSSQFRWTGSAYAAILASPGTTDAVTEGSTNLYHTVARVRAAVLTGLSLVSSTAVTATDTILSAIGKLQKQITDIPALPSTVAQAEAEAGIATTTRLWTAQRVKQAIEANAPAGSGSNIFTASGAISAKKACVLNSDGTVSQSVIAVASYSTGVNIDGSNYSNISLCLDPVNNRVVMFYRDPDDSNFGNARLGTFSGGSITWSAEVEFSGTAIQSGVNPISSAYDPDTGQILVFYNVGGVGKCRLATVDVGGDTITFGAELNTALTVAEVGCCYDESVNLFLCTHRDGSALKAFTLSVAGTSLTVETTNTIYASNVSGYTCQAIFLKGHATAMNVVIANLGGTSNMWIVKITPGTFAINASGSIDINDGGGGSGYARGGQCMAWSQSKQQLLVLYDNGPSTYYLYCNNYTTDGTSFTRQGTTPVDNGFFSLLSSQFPSIIVSKNGDVVSVCYPDQSDSNYGKVRCSPSITTGGLSFTTETTFYSGSVNFVAQAPSLDSAYSLCCYNLSVHGIGRNFVITLPRPDSRTKFVGFSKSGVSDGASVELATLGATIDGLSGLTISTKYYLSSSDGQTLSTTPSGPVALYTIAADKGVVVGTNITTV